MKANELRIGNYINIDLPISNEGKLTRIGAINSKKVNGVEITKYKPIPLTEEWLIKFGFIFGIKLHDFVKGKHQFVEFNVLNGYFSESGVFYYSMKTQIKYVHQLQNLYFALTGEELTLQD